MFCVSVRFQIVLFCFCMGVLVVVVNLVCWVYIIPESAFCLRFGDFVSLGFGFVFEFRCFYRYFGGFAVLDVGAVMCPFVDFAVALAFCVFTLCFDFGICSVFAVVWFDILVLLLCSVLLWLWCSVLFVLVRYWVWF